MVRWNYIMEESDTLDLRRAGEKGEDMGHYLNPGNEGFRRALRAKIYIDKTGMIEYLNGVIGTDDGLVCVSRPRRFGKSMAANMLTAYYDRECDSRELCFWRLIM